MFRVTADSLQAYLDFDPERRPGLVRLHKLMVESAPGLKRYFHTGSPPGEPGMRMNMIGYGKVLYEVKSGKTTDWPVIGVALQKNYISVYVSVTRAGEPLVNAYAGRLGEARVGVNNFSFVRFDDLELPALSSLLAEADSIFRSGCQ
ncbi:MAG TPA: hypothetical protein VG815_12315 [Chloroflexota bacterium]|nr:hypothetical protein [Chloroflexota bacterium]